MYRIVQHFPFTNKLLLLYAKSSLQKWFFIDLLITGSKNSLSFKVT